jgi:hypothetical protein
MSDNDVEDAFDEFDRSWAESHGVFERRTIQRELELVVMPGWDTVAPRWPHGSAFVTLASVGWMRRKTYSEHVRQ